MPDYPDTFALTDAQLDEMEKIAIIGGVAKRLWQAGPWTGRLAGAGVGSAVGAGAGYATGQTPEERKWRALGGAVLGGIGGLVPGQFATAKGVGQAKRFGQRQVYGATGFLPHESKMRYIEKLKPGDKLKAQRAIKMNVPEEKSLAELVAKKRGPLKEFRAKRQLAAEGHQRALAREGLTNIPETAKGYLLGTPGMSRRQIVKSQLLAPGAALGIGVPAAFAAPGLAESVKERDPRLAARTLAETAGYSLSGGLPLTSALAVGSGASYLAGKLTGARPPAGAAPGRVVPQGRTR